MQVVCLSEEQFQHLSDLVAKGFDAVVEQVRRAQTSNTKNINELEKKIESLFNTLNQPK